jgi:ribose transport system permease protein
MKDVSDVTPVAPPALEAGATAKSKLSRIGLAHFVSSQSLLILTVIAIIVFSALRPHTFPTAFNMRSILSSEAVLAMLALAEMIVLSVNQFDLSIGYSVGLITITVVALETNHHLNSSVGIVVGLAMGLGIGLANGIIVTFGKIDSFIATLASGTVIYGISNWYTGGIEKEGVVSKFFGSIAGGRLLAVPLPAVYVAIVAVVLWIVFEYFPVGRHLYALGANRKAAELLGIRSNGHIIGAFLATGLLVGVSGVMTASLLQVGNPAVGPEYLLPAFVGALLGATSVRPGRVNAGGTVIAIVLLAVVISGLEHLGAQAYVESLFDGGTLLVATGMAGYAARRRLRQRSTDVVPEG